MQEAKENLDRVKLQGERKLAQYQGGCRDAEEDAGAEPGPSSNATRNS